MGATDLLKQFIRGKYEFLIVFSCFKNQDWQAQTLKAEREIRKRHEIADRRLLVNFYILISNARNLINEINSLKGSTTAAVIPFTFNELIGASDDELPNLIKNRFSEYYFENNMLGDSSAIDDDNLLFGDRGKIADAIAARCEEKKNSGIFGLRRSGKTSVLNAVLRRLDRNNIKYVKIESRSGLSTLDSWKTALFDIAREIRKVTLNIQQDDQETRQEFNTRLKLNSTEEDYKKRAASYFVEDVKLYTKDEPAFVIAIDEIELITYNTATSATWNNVEAYTGFWGALRDCGCALIVCGVNSSINEINAISFNGQEGDNPMYGRITCYSDFGDTYLPAFTDEQTKVMINQLGGFSNIAFSHVYAEINKEFGGQPYAIRQFCSYVFEKVKQYRKQNEVYEVSKPTIDNLLTKFSSSNEGNNLAKVILQHLRIFNDEYEMLKKIALSPEKYSKIESDDLSGIDHLCKYGLIEYDFNTHFISLKLNLIKDYICRNSEKDPSDMNNDERRRYIQDSVCDVETKLKKYIKDYYKYARKNYREDFRQYLVTELKKNRSNIIVKHKNYDIDPETCEFADFFDHRKYIMYFSSLKNIILDRWKDLGGNIMDAGLTREEFKLCMEKLNAGRIDADHYDAENKNDFPKNWTIDEQTMNDFSFALKKINIFLNTME